MNWLPHLDLKAQRHKARFAKQFISIQQIFLLNDLVSVEFTETEENTMLLGFQKGFIQVRFACDTARQMWRKELKRFLAAKKGVVCSISSPHRGFKSTFSAISVK